MISYRTERSHARSRTNRIFSKVVVFWRGSWVFRSFPLCLCGAGYRQSRATLNGNPKERTTSKMGFPLRTVIYPAEKFIWSKDLLFFFLVSCIDRELFCFSFDLFLFTFFPIFDRESFFSFSFLSFHFLLSDLWLGIRILAIVIRSPLRRFCCPFLQGKGWGFFSWTKVQSSLRLCLNMVFSSCEPNFDIWGKTNSCVKASVSGWISILFPRGMRNNDDLETTCKISHGYS